MISFDYVRTEFNGIQHIGHQSTSSDVFMCSYSPVDNKPGDSVSFALSSPVEGYTSFSDIESYSNTIGGINSFVIIALSPRFFRDKSSLEYSTILSFAERRWLVGLSKELNRVSNKGPEFDDYKAYVGIYKQNDLRFTPKEFLKPKSGVSYVSVDSDLLLNDTSPLISFIGFFGKVAGFKTPNPNVAYKRSSVNKYSTDSDLNKELLTEEYALLSASNLSGVKSESGYLIEDSFGFASENFSLPEESGWKVYHHGGNYVSDYSAPGLRFLTGNIVIGRSKIPLQKISEVTGYDGVDEVGDIETAITSVNKQIPYSNGYFMDGKFWVAFNGSYESGNLSKIYITGFKSSSFDSNSLGSSYCDGFGFSAWISAPGKLSVCYIDSSETPISNVVDIDFTPSTPSGEYQYAEFDFVMYVSPSGTTSVGATIPSVGSSVWVWPSISVKPTSPTLKIGSYSPINYVTNPMHVGFGSKVDTDVIYGISRYNVVDTSQKYGQIIMDFYINSNSFPIDGHVICRGQGYDPVIDSIIHGFSVYSWDGREWRLLSDVISDEDVFTSVSFSIPKEAVLYSSLGRYCKLMISPMSFNSLPNPNGDVSISKSFIEVDYIQLKERGVDVVMDNLSDVIIVQERSSDIGFTDRSSVLLQFDIQSAKGINTVKSGDIIGNSIIAPIEEILSVYSLGLVDGDYAVQEELVKGIDYNLVYIDPVYRGSSKEIVNIIVSPSYQQERLRVFYRGHDKVLEVQNYIDNSPQKKRDTAYIVYHAKSVFVDVILYVTSNIVSLEKQVREYILTNPVSIKMQDIFAFSNSFNSTLHTLNGFNQNYASYFEVSRIADTGNVFTTREYSHVIRDDREYFVPRRIITVEFNNV